MVIADPLSALFFVCFAAGAVLILLMAMSGLWSLPVHVHHGAFHLPWSHANAVATHASGSGGTGHAHASTVEDASPFNTISILTWLTWFGGAGYLLRTHSPLAGWIIVGVATILGVLAGGAVFLLLARVLLPNQTILDPTDYEQVGTVGRTTATIRESGTGEIVYTKGGTRHVEAARSATGTPIERGTEVVIVRYERGVAYVQPWTQFMEEAERARPIR